MELLNKNLLQYSENFIKNRDTKTEKSIDYENPVDWMTREHCIFYLTERRECYIDFQYCVGIYDCPEYKQEKAKKALEKIEGRELEFVKMAEKNLNKACEEFRLLSHIAKRVLMFLKEKIENNRDEL